MPVRGGPAAPSRAGPGAPSGAAEARRCACGHAPAATRSAPPATTPLPLRRGGGATASGVAAPPGSRERIGPPCLGVCTHCDPRKRAWTAAVVVAGARGYCFWLAVGSPCLGVCTHCDPIMCGGTRGRTCDTGKDTVHRALTSEYESSTIASSTLRTTHRASERRAGAINRWMEEQLPVIACLAHRLAPARQRPVPRGAGPSVCVATYLTRM
eukprot:COSAG01_NODE_9950_length_2292_cov_1.992711_2_plen_212_part_00